VLLTKMGRFTCRAAIGMHDMARCLALRDLCFSGAGNAPGAQRDRFDAQCQHFMIEEDASHQLVCCFRLMIMTSGLTIDTSYSAQFYDLEALILQREPILELGRFCVDPGRPDPDILRLAWAHITRLAVAEKVGLLMGCSSFAGTDWRPYEPAFLALHRDHRAPDISAPRVKSADFIDFRTLEPAPEQALNPKQTETLAKDKQDVLRGMRQMPSLLRTYLMMGGWVSDHAVIDRDLGTIHVFTAVEVARIPPPRLRALLALAGQSQEY
jgi:L-ornithine Nalpha-acyltransferase